MNADPTQHDLEDAGLPPSPAITREARERSRRRVETVIKVCWGIIILKTFAVTWVVHHYAMPFNPMWVVAPTVGIAFVATSLYFLLRE
jgi:hypothetical protein